MYMGQLRWCRLPRSAGSRVVGNVLEGTSPEPQPGFVEMHSFGGCEACQQDLFPVSAGQWSPQA
jgi:hypothetical protein